MAFTTITQGLTLTIPTNGTRNWGTTLKNTTWTKISSHDHTGSGNGSQLGASSISPNSLGNDALAKNRGDFYLSTPLVPAGAAQTVDWDSGQVQVLDLGSATGDVTVTMSNPVEGGRYRLHLIQGATARDIVWPVAVIWPQGQQALLTQTDDAVDVIEIFYDGTNYFADWQLDFS